MKQINRIDFQNHVVIIRYNDEADPTWVEERALVVNWRKHPNVERLAHVGYHVFHLLIEHPEKTAVPDEVLQEWLGQLFAERPAREHETP